MHGGHIQNGYVLIDPWHCVDVSAFSWVFSLVAALPCFELVPRKFLGEIRIDKITLGVFVVPKYDLSCVSLCCIINRQSTQFGQDLPCYEVVPAILEYCLSSN